MQKNHIANVAYTAKRVHMTNCSIIEIKRICVQETGDNI